MTLLPPSSHPLSHPMHPLSVPHMITLENTYAQHHNLYNLMLNAGSEAAMIILARTPPHASFIILAGPGNNGGDAIIIANILARHNRNITLFSHHSHSPSHSPSPSPSPSPLRQQALLNTHLNPLPLSQFSSAHLSTSTVVIDGLLGTGIKRKLKGNILHALNLLAAHPHIPLFALDIISCASAHTGHVLMSPPLPFAHTTITFHRPKIGHFIHPTKNISGKLISVDIGLPLFAHHSPPLPSDKLIANHPSLWQHLISTPSLTQHKYTKGVLAIKASHSMPGASILAAKAAKKIGCSTIILFSPEKYIHLFLSLCEPHMIVKPFANPLQLADLINQNTRISAILLGSGDTDTLSLQNILPKLSPSLPLVLDAGIFQAFQDSPSSFIKLMKNRNTNSAVLTPHDGEYNRIFSPPPHLSSRPERALFASQCTQQTLLLKGNDTSIASPSHPTLIETLAPPSLATAGSGDVLAGLIAGLISQHMPTSLASAYASHLHSKAALSHPHLHISAEQLIDLISPLTSEPLTREPLTREPLTSEPLSPSLPSDTHP